MASKRDLYDVLGVPKGAGEKDVRQAYRRLARKHHPDLNPNDKAAEARFKEIQHAYDVLSDKKTRELYDRHGHDWERIEAGGGVSPPPGGRPGAGARPGQRADFDFGQIFGADTFEGLLVEYVQSRGASVIIRGLRAVSDFEYEFQMALMNRHQAPGIETTFMMPAEQYTYISSRLIKEVFALGGRVHGLVPPTVEERLRAKHRERLIPGAREA